MTTISGNTVANTVGVSRTPKSGFQLEVIGELKLQCAYYIDHTSQNCCAQLLAGCDPLKEGFGDAVIGELETGTEATTEASMLKISNHLGRYLPSGAWQYLKYKYSMYAFTGVIVCIK